MQRADNVEQFTAGEGAICRKRQRQRKHGLIRTPYVSPTKPVRLRRSKTKGNIDGAQTVAEAGCVNLGIDYRNVNIAPAINTDAVPLETRSVQSTERLTAEWVSVTEFHKFDKFGNTDSRYTGHTDSKPNTRNSKSETPAIIDQPKPLGFGRVKNYVEKINRYNEKEIPDYVKDGRKKVVKNYLEITTNGTPKKNYCLIPKPSKSQHSTNRFRSLSEKAETSVIGQTIEQCKSFVNRDEFTENKVEIEQSISIETQDEFIKSKPDTEFNGLLNQFTSDEQQHTSTKYKNLHSDKTNGLYSKLDGENGKDRLEILSTSHYAHDLAISQDVDYLDTAESALPKTNSETVAFKIEAEDKVNSSFEDKDDDKIIETRSHCSQLWSPTLVKQRSDDTDIAEPIKYEIPQYTSVSDESTSEIGQTVEQSKSFANGDEFTENRSEIKQSNSIVTQDEFNKSKPGTEFNGLLNQFTLDEQQQTSTKDKNLHYHKTNDLYSKLDGENGEDKFEILSTSHYAHDIAISQDVIYLDTAESALPKTNSETVAFKIEGEDKVDSSFGGKHDDKIIETRSHCSQLCSPTLVKQRSNDTDIAEPIKYETPQYTSVSDESTSEIGQTIELCKSFANGDEFTGNISEIEQSNSLTQDEFIKSKPDTEFNGLLNQFTLVEQQHTSTKDKNLHSDKTNGLYSKLDGENGKDRLEILSTSHYAHDLDISQDVDYLDTAESALPKTISETVAFKNEAEDKVNSSFEGKDVDKIIETRSHCSQLCSPTIVKQRSDDTDIAEPIKYEIPQHTSVSDESIRRELNGSKLYGGNKAYLNSFMRKHGKEGLKYTSVGNLYTDRAEENSGDFVHVFSNAVNCIKSIDTHSDATGIKPIQNVQNAESDLMKDIIKEKEACIPEDLGQFVGNKLDYRSDEEIFIENQSGLAIIGMLHVNQVASSKNDVDLHRLSSEWKPGSQAETVPVMERNKETVVNDDKDLSTTKARQTPNPDGQGARPKGKQQIRSL